MDPKAASKQLGRLLGSARERAAGVIAPASHVDVARLASVADASTTAEVYDRDVLDLDLSDAIARAESAEAEVALLRKELARKDEVIRQAREALTGARIALSDHLRITSS